MKGQKRDLPVSGAALMMAMILSMVGPASIGAEYYRYIDESGVVRFAEDLHDVPEAQRSRIKKVTSGKSVTKNPAPKDPDQKDIEDSDQAVESSERGEEAKRVETNDDDLKQLEFEYLTKQKEVLDREFETLVKEKEEITQQKKKIGIDEYNAMVRQFNERISVYEERLKAFEEAANAFNSRMNQ